LAALAPRAVVDQRRDGSAGDVTSTAADRSADCATVTEIVAVS
jgi:hypothetical protein